MSKSSLYLDKTLKEMVVRGVWAEDGRGGGGGICLFLTKFLKTSLIRPTRLVISTTFSLPEVDRINAVSL